MRRGKLGPWWAAIVPAAAVLLVGCPGDSDKAQPTAAAEGGNVVQPGAPGAPSRRLSAEEVARLDSPRHTAEDVDFMKGMIHHHRQAVRMTKLVPERTTNRDIRLLSKRIEASQQVEMDTMRRWLRLRDVARPEHVHGHGAGDPLMPGMLTAGEFDRLDAADGSGFGRLFLRYMTRHHQGALTMVAQLHADGGALEPEIGAFTRHVEADQAIEIGRMQDLLAGRAPR